MTELMQAAFWNLVSLAPFIFALWLVDSVLYFFRHMRWTGNPWIMLVEAILIPGLVQLIAERWSFLDQFRSSLWLLPALILVLKLTISLIMQSVQLHLQARRSDSRSSSWAGLAFVLGRGFGAALAFAGAVQFVQTDFAGSPYIFDQMYFRIPLTDFIPPIALFLAIADLVIWQLCWRMPCSPAQSIPLEMAILATAQTFAYSTVDKPAGFLLFFFVAKAVVSGLASAMPSSSQGAHSNIRYRQVIKSTLLRSVVCSILLWRLATGFGII